MPSVKDKHSLDEQVSAFLSGKSFEETLALLSKVISIESHPLYTQPPQSIEDSHRFGWMRGLALQTETLMHGRWHSWLSVIEKGDLKDTDEIQSIDISMFPAGKKDVDKMLDNCLTPVKHYGVTIYDFIQWIGYALGISYSKKPNVKEEVWKHWYENFNLDLLLLNPSDHLSVFIANHGQSGVLDYFPTPLNITIMMNKMLNTDGNNRTDTLYEPCLGAGAMLLPSGSLNLVGTDLSYIMVQASAIQAFLYQPSLLYTPVPIVGLHASKEEQRINRYFEFKTDTRIYHGDSIFGEYSAPTRIFEEDSPFVDLYINPIDITKRSIFDVEDLMLEPWDQLSDEDKFKIVEAQAREIGFQQVLTNPPFNARMPKHEMQRIHDLEKSNKAFMEQRKKRVQLHPAATSIEHATEYDLQVAKTKSKKVLEGQYEFIL